MVFSTSPALGHDSLKVWPMSCLDPNCILRTCEFQIQVALSSTLRPHLCNPRPILSIANNDDSSYVSELSNTQPNNCQKRHYDKASLCWATIRGPLLATYRLYLGPKHHYHISAAQDFYLWTTYFLLKMVFISIHLLSLIFSFSSFSESVKEIRRKILESWFNTKSRSNCSSDHSEGKKAFFCFYFKFPWEQRHGVR